MKHLVSLALLLSTLAPLAFAQATNPVLARASLDADSAWVGQRVLLHIDVLSPDGWAKLSTEPPVDIAGAHVIRTESQGQRLNETLEGTAYSGQRYEYSLFPRRAGSLRIPALTLTVAVTTYGAGGGTFSHVASTAPLVLPVRLPPGVKTAVDLISTSHLTASQEWDPPLPHTFTVGQSLVRAITVTAEDVSAMAFPEWLGNVPDGVGVYPSQPKLSDKADRGSLTGTRSERVTYMLQRPGALVLPDVQVVWFDLKSQTLKTETLAGITLKVEAGLVPDGKTGAQRATLGPLVFGTVLVLVGVVVMPWMFRHRLAAWGRHQCARYRKSEAAAFRTFQRACRGTDAIATWNALMRWLDRTQEGTARLDAFIAAHGDEDAHTAVQGLLSAIEASSPWPGRDLRTAIGRAHTQHRRHRAVEKRTSRVLPPLNP